MINDPAFLPSYRSIRRGRRLDPGTRRLLATAGSIGAVLVVTIGGWSLIHRGPGAVPVIAAPSGPMRVKPVNPGGMTVIGANQDLMGAGASDESVKMQSAPEKPALAALHALEAKPPAGAPPAPPAATVRPASAPPAVAASVSPPTASSAQVAVTQTAASSAAASPAPVSLAPSMAGQRMPGAGTAVQLAAMDSREAAMTEWQHLAQRMPALLGNRQPTVQRAEVGGRTVWRLRTTGFASIAVATQFCQQVRAQGGGCAIAAF